MFDRSGNATSTILLDGRVVGVWDLEEEELTVKIHLFKKVENNLLTEIYSKAEEIGKFINGEEVKIIKCNSMTPLTRRTAGGFMSPLKNC